MIILFIALFFVIVLLTVLLTVSFFLFVKLIIEEKEYEKSAYSQITRVPYSAVKKDIGKSGEYYTYKALQAFEPCGARFLFNLYLPKSNGQTTEIDILMICSKGIFVFESKNYSGWIFGNESQKQWCQTLPIGKGRSQKNYFYNPIVQNRSHVAHLKAFLSEHIPMYSIIVFSERCTLKSVPENNNEVKVIKRNMVYETVWRIYTSNPYDALSAEQICHIYNSLFPYTQIDESRKIQHINNIYNNTNSVRR